VEIIATERLRLRPLQSSDAAFVLSLLNEPSFIQFIGDRKVRSLEQAREYIANGPAASYEQFGYGLLLVELKESHTPIGMCGLVQRNYLPDADIGFAFSPAYWSQGYAREAAHAALNYAMNTLHFKRIAAIVQPDNAASLKLLETLGFRTERRFKISAVAEELLLLVYKTGNCLLLYCFV
jgi:RimJ/RimL family protein N-acetyltransferase